MVLTICPQPIVNDSTWFVSPRKRPTTTHNDDGSKELFENFEFKSQIYKLNVYQSQISILEGDNTLLLPFLDDTNGLSSYGGGRYINIVIPESDTILLDFNMAYNPYCAYNERYSCPIVPKENYLPFRVEAGVMYNNEY